MQSVIYNAFTILGNLHDAEDVAQEAFVAMFKNIKQLRSPEAIDVWMLRIVQNKCNDFLGRRSNRAEDLDIEDEDILIEEDDEDFLPAEYAENRELADKLYDVVMGLPAKRREVIFLYYYQDLSYKEIAEVTNSSIKTVSANITRARGMIKKRIEKTETQSRSILGGAAATTVMGRVLHEQAAFRVPAESTAAVQQRCMAVFRGLRYRAAGSALSAGKTAGVIGGVSALAVAVIIGAADIPLEDGIPARPQTPASAGLDKAGSIVFDGNGSDGHVNPSNAALEDVHMEISAVAWRIHDLEGNVLFGGEGQDPSSGFAALKESEDTGWYDLVFRIQDSAGDIVEKIRSFEIR
jgi:RNA polymerase sigma-70 factor (ECF subfamily)